MKKALEHDNRVVEGELITSDEWSEDQFNKAEPASSQEEMAMRFRASQMQGVIGAFEKGAYAQQTGFGLGDIGGILGGGLFGRR